MCTQPDNLPFSARDASGFENRIAALLADALGADLTLHALPRPTAQAQSLALRSGECDVIMGVSDGTQGFLTTLAYYRSHPVFVQRQDAETPVTSLDDEVLHDLRIGVHAGGGLRTTRVALAQHDLLGQVTSFAWDAEGDAPLAAPIRAVAHGEVDVALVWGPVGGYFAARQDTPLTVRPAEPLVQLPALNTVVPIAIGVRPGDEALRDLLDDALAARWDEIQSILDDFHVPRLDTPRPVARQAGDARGPRIALILPMPSGETPLDPAAPSIAATSARMGAIAAVEDLIRAGGDAPAPELLLASAPTPDAAVRAARRMIRADGAVALVGGMGDGHAAALADVAQATQVPLLNVANQDHALREACLPWTVHVAPDEAAHLEALAAWFTDDGLDRWFLLHDDRPRGRTLADLASAALQRHAGVQVVGRAAVGDPPHFDRVLAAAAEPQPDALLALLDWRGQLDLLGFMGALGPDATLVGLPVPATQTRDFYDAWRNAAFGVDALRRTATWEATWEEPAADALSESFRARWGLPMDGPAWTAYQAVSILGRAFAGGGEAGGEALLQRLSDADVVAEPAFGVGYDPASRQLLPPLHLLRIEPEGEQPLGFARHLDAMATTVHARCPAGETSE